MILRFILLLSFLYHSDVLWWIVYTGLIIILLRYRILYTLFLRFFSHEILFIHCSCLPFIFLLVSNLDFGLSFFLSLALLTIVFGLEIWVCFTFIKCLEGDSISMLLNSYSILWVSLIAPPNLLFSFESLSLISQIIDH